MDKKACKTNSIINLQKNKALAFIKWLLQFLIISRLIFYSFKSRESISIVLFY